MFTIEQQGEGRKKYILRLIEKKKKRNEIEMNELYNLYEWACRRNK